MAVDPINSIPEAVLHQTPVMQPFQPVRQQQPAQRNEQEQLHRLEQGGPLPRRAQQGPQSMQDPRSMQNGRAAPMAMPVSQQNVPQGVGLQRADPARQREQSTAPRSAKMVQPAMVPVMPADRQGIAPPLRGDRSDIARLGRSAPPQLIALPSQQLNHSVTTPRQPSRLTPLSDPPISRQHKSSQPVSGAPFDSNVDVHRVGSVSRPNPADSYLDRLEQNSHIQGMLSDAPSRTIHSDFVPRETRGRQSASVADKPLPNPHVQGDIQPRRDPSRASSAGNDTHAPRKGRHLSLSEGLHCHALASNHVPDGDRYPTFPGISNGRSHSRRSSEGNVDPAGLRLPLYV